MCVVVKLQDGSRRVVVRRHRLHVCNHERSHGVLLVGTRHVFGLVCRSLDGRMIEKVARAEHDACDCLYGSVEHARRSLLAVYIISSRVSLYRQARLYVIRLARLVVFHHASIACAALHLHHGLAVHHDARAHVALVVYELDVHLSVVVLCRLDVKFDGKFLCRRYQFFNLRIVVRVLVAHIHPFAVKFHRSPQR